MTVLVVCGHEHSKQKNAECDISLTLCRGRAEEDGWMDDISLCEFVSIRSDVASGLFPPL